VKKYDNALSRFYTIPERNGQTDRRTDTFAKELLKKYPAHSVDFIWFLD